MYFLTSTAHCANVCAPAFKFVPNDSPPSFCNFATIHVIKAANNVPINIIILTLDNMTQHLSFSLMILIYV